MRINNQEGNREQLGGRVASAVMRINSQEGIREQLAPNTSQNQNQNQNQNQSQNQNQNQQQQQQPAARKDNVAKKRETPNLTPIEIASLFSEKFYSKLVCNRETLFQFFADDSHLVSGYHGERVKVCSGQAEIHCRFQEPDYDIAFTDIICLDALGFANGQIMVQTNGLCEAADGGQRSFYESFILAPQAGGGFYVSANIRRVAREVFWQKEAAPPVTPAPKAASTSSSTTPKVDHVRNVSQKEEPIKPKTQQASTAPPSSAQQKVSTAPPPSAPQKASAAPPPSAAQKVSTAPPPSTPQKMSTAPPPSTPQKVPTAPTPSAPQNASIAPPSLAPATPVEAPIPTRPVSNDPSGKRNDSKRTSKNMPTEAVKPMKASGAPPPANEVSKRPVGAEVPSSSGPAKTPAKPTETTPIIKTTFAAQAAADPQVPRSAPAPQPSPPHSGSAQPILPVTAPAAPRSWASAAANNAHASWDKKNIAEVKSTSTKPPRSPTKTSSSPTGHGSRRRSSDFSLSIFVRGANMQLGVTRQDLFDAFSQFGEVVLVEFLKTGALVEFANPAIAHEATHKHVPLRNGIVVVTEPKKDMRGSRPPSGSGPGRGGGGVSRSPGNSNRGNRRGNS